MSTEAKKQLVVNEDGDVFTSPEEMESWEEWAARMAATAQPETPMNHKGATAPFFVPTRSRSGNKERKNAGKHVPGLTAERYHRHAEATENRLFPNVIQEELWK